MRRLPFLLIPFLCLPFAATSAQEFTVGYLEIDQPVIEGSQCAFSDAHGIVLKSDWVKKIWLNINGTLIELDGTRTDAETISDTDNKQWRDTFGGNGITAVLDLKQTGTGDDASAYKGSLLVKRGRVQKRLVITGGCGA
jgi:hypothetical protein